MKNNARKTFCILHSAFCIAVAAATAYADAVKVGLQETGNVHVDSGSTSAAWGR